MKPQIYKNRTFSLPVEISMELHLFVKSRERSRFVAEAIRRELEIKKRELREAYLSANKDIGQQEALAEWCGTLADNEDEW
ncbi:MAG: hypothetical protein ACXWM7_07215 [Parachlamydiaceae bacterium]